MDSGKINEKILKGIKKNCEDDEVLADFLIYLVYEEAEHSGKWWWKDTYRKKVEEFSEKWGGSNED